MCKLYQPQGLEKIPEINKRRVFNKAVGPGKNAKLINVGPTSIPDSRVIESSKVHLQMTRNFTSPSEKLLYCKSTQVFF